MNEQKRGAPSVRAVPNANPLPASRAFGVESSLAAVAGYLPVIILSLVNLKRKC